MDKNIIWQSALVGVGTAAAIAFLVLPMLALWAGMVYLTQIISGINFLPPDMPSDIIEILSLKRFAIALIIMCEGIGAYLVWEKVLGKIEKRVEQK